MHYLEIQSFFLDNFITGIISSDCKEPCQQTSTEVGFIAEEQNNYPNSNLIHISFTNDAKVTEVRLKKFSFMEMLNILGSNLGLYPGMGLHQLIGKI